MKVVGTTAGTPAVPKVSDIVSTHDLRFRETDNAMELAIELVSSHLPGAPVVGKEDEYVGFINEGDYSSNRCRHRLKKCNRAWDYEQGLHWS